MSDKDSKTNEVVKCEICGKTLTRQASQEREQGHRCASIIEAGWTAEKLAENYARLSATEIPEGYVKVAEVHRYIKAHPEFGATVSKMVKALGRDRGLEPAAHATIQPVYVGRVRYIDGVYVTKAGLEAIATGDYTGIK